MTQANYITFFPHTMPPLVILLSHRKPLILLMVFFYPLTHLLMSQFFSPKIAKLAETPLDDHSLSLESSLVQKHYSIAQMTFLIAKLSSFFRKKRYKYSPDTNNITEEINKALPKHIPPTTYPAIAPHPTLVPQPPSLMFFKVLTQTYVLFMPNC